MRGRILMLLLFAANAHNFLRVLGALDEDKVTKQLNRMEMDQYTEVLEVKSMIYKLIQANEKIAARMEKLEEPQNDTRVCSDKDESQMTTIVNTLQQVEATLEYVKSQVQQNAFYFKLLPICERWMQTHNLNGSDFFIAEGKHFYFDFTTALNWDGARDLCVEKGMQLAMLKTTSEMDAVKEELIRLEAEEFYWLGASDVGQTPGQYRWADGKLVDGNMWRNGQIYKTNGNLTEKTCVDFYVGYAGLTDEWCSNLNRILCQVPATLAACL